MRRVFLLLLCRLLHTQDQFQRKVLTGAKHREERTLNATMPMMMPAAKNTKAWMSQMTPQTARIL